MYNVLKDLPTLPIVLIFEKLLRIYPPEVAAGHGWLSFCGFLSQSPLTSQQRMYKSPPARAL